MIVDCHSCGATYNISDEKVRGRRVRVRCKSCGAGIIVDGAQLAAEDATRVYAPTFEPAAYAERDDRDESTRVFSAPAAFAAEAADESTRVFSASSVFAAPAAQAPPTSGDWLVNASDTQQRTMKLAEIVNDYNGGLLSEDAYIWRDGMTDWLPLRQVPEIRAALESAEATRVVSPAVAVRPPLGQRSSAPPAVVTYSAPAAPPRARRADAAPQASVEYASQPIALAPPKPASLPSVPAPAFAPPPSFVPAPPLAPAPAPARAAPPARRREGRARSGADLFGPSESAGSEAALLSSSSLPLSQYDEKPIGARNESSVLFSLDTLKAGVRRGGPSSAPPRHIAAGPPTAADILGMSAGGGMPGMGSSAALLSAPAVEQPFAPPPRSVPPQLEEQPYRSRMDTTPPTSRSRASVVLIGAVLIAAAFVAGGVFFVLRSRLAVPAAETDPAASARAAQPNVVAPTAVAAAPVPAPPPAATPVVTPPPAPVAAAPAPVLPAAPPVAKAATEPAPNARLEAMKAAIKANAASSTPPSDTGSGTKSGQKVVLAEESAPAAPAAPADSPAPAAEDKPEEPAKPPFDTSAAKTALESASAGAASCKQPLGPTGRGKVQVTFSPSGRATSATVIEGDFGGTPTGGCVAKMFRGARVPAFTGDPVTVSKSFTIPE